jgi:hypothetical protein
MAESSAEPREPSHPPSDPQSGLSALSSHSRHSRSARNGLGFGEEDRPVRAQLAAALLVGLVLVATGLYLWRRPHTPPDASAAESASASAAALLLADAAVITPAPVDAGPASAVTLSDARVLGCHDRGPRKTPADQCDHLASIEQALSRAIEQSAACVPSSAGGGSIEYVADVSFLRHKVKVLLPRAGRSVHDRKAIQACASSVREAMQTVSIEGVDHQHARYQISVTASYPPKS